jgi:hypothetical protein
LSIACQSRKTVSINSFLTLDFHVGWQTPKLITYFQKTGGLSKKCLVTEVREHLVFWRHSDTLIIVIHRPSDSIIIVIHRPSDSIIIVIHRPSESIIIVIHRPSDSLIHTDFTTNSLNFVFIFIIHSSYMFRPYTYIVATFMWTYTAYMETCYTQSADYVRIRNSIRIQRNYHYIRRQDMNWWL